jgi:ABC-type dipeptide/oligopeptide/nickel transport system permease component
MPAYLMSRLLMAAWVIFGVTSLVFFLIHWVPGDPAIVKPCARRWVLISRFFANGFHS